MEQPPLETVTETGYALQVLLVSRDENLIEEIVTQLGADSVVIVPDLKGAQHKLGYLDCAVAIYDTDSLKSYGRVVRLKENHPALAIVAVCEKALVAELMNSPVSKLVFRVMAKPLGAGQFKLALGSAYTEYEQLRRRVADGEDIAVSANIPKGTGALSVLHDRRQLAAAVSIPVLLVCAVAFWLLRGNGDDISQDAGVVTPPEQQDTMPSAPPQVEQINDLLALAQSAATNGRLIKPDNSSAVYYYNQALRLDPFDGDALAGMNEVTDQLVSRAYTFLAADNTSAATSDLDAVEAIRPTHSRLAEVRDALAQKEAELEVLTREEELAALAVEAEQAATEAAAREQALLREIDEAINANNLVSLREGTAVRLVNDAWSIQETPSPQLRARAERLGALIVQAATTALSASDLRLAETLAAQLANLPPVLVAGRETLDREIAEAIRVANAVIEPARRTRMVQPTYPRNASRRGIEGWVHLSFNITPRGDVADVEVIEQTPNETFEDAARAAVSEWKYLPRTIDGEPAEETMEVRLQFRL